LAQRGSEKEKVEIRVLGKLALEVGGRESNAISSRRARSLLAWLAIHPGLHPRSRVAGVFWPDVLEESARSSLRTTLAILRRELGESVAGVVTASRERVGIEPGPGLSIDLDDFNRLVSRGELESAAALCRGDLLADLDDDWVNESREHHRNRLAGVLGQLAEEAERSGDLGTALDRTRDQVKLDPLSEEAQRELIRRLAAAGDRAGSLAAYQSYAVRLQREFGIAPSAECRELLERVRSGEASRHPAVNGDGSTASTSQPVASEVAYPPLATPVETRYARSGELSIAYQVVGTGRDLVFVPGSLSHVELGWETPAAAGMYRRLSRFARMITFDKRGMGLSDRTAELPTLEERMDDVRAVMDAAECERAAIVGISEGGPMAILFAATYPERVSALVLWCTFARMAWAPDYPEGVDPQLSEQFLDQIEQLWGQGRVWPMISIHDAPHDEATRRHLARFERAAATPKMAAAANEFGMHIDAREALPAISAPTLVVHRTGDPLVGVEHGRYLAEHIPEARLMEFPGDFHFSAVGKDEEILDEIEEFLTGSRQEHAIDRVLKTVMFTDIVGSTERVVRMGDRRWHELLEAHRSAVRRELERFGGEEVRTIGDGFLACFDGPARAIRCARAITDKVGADALEVRAGLHTGECDVLGDDLTGVAVHIGARVGGLAGPREVLVTRTVRDLVTGSGIEFQDRGRHTLKGIPGEWELLAVKA
jgi:pimeloyl-ACP methyl ester carboxylesterase/DNA-binding SARP family transcriptional activator